MHPDFEPMKAFQLVDEQKKGALDSAAIVAYLQKHHVKAEDADGDDIVQEYDGDEDLALNFDEWCQLVLPAANANLRHIASTRRFNSYFRPDDPLPYEVVSLLTRLIEKETQLQRHRNDMKRQLLKCTDFIKIKSFNEISRGFHSICMPDLITFLENNGFYPRREDIEAILRRLDHDANRMRSYDEFCELTAVQDR